MIKNNNKLIDFLICCKKQKVIFIPTPGKIGDALLAHASYQLFDTYQIDYINGIYNMKYNGQFIVIGGGGNLVGHLYKELEQFISNNIKTNQITILPHTIYNLPKVKQWLDKPNFTVFCREPQTFEYLKQYNNKTQNVYLVEDMSCFLAQQEFKQYKSVVSNGSCNAFRTDSESVQSIIPHDNFDVSATWNGAFWHNKNLCKHVVHSMASYLSKFAIVNTDRLHTAILAGILGKKVNLYTGSYHKIKSIYDLSISLRWPNIRLIEKI
jgi:exopolysaccharide biosynthesis predicted pyruvyltransferase EpsI